MLYLNEVECALYQLHIFPGMCQPSDSCHVLPSLVALALQLYSACFAWALHWLVARLLLKGMNVPGVAWSELLAYTGYPFVLICFTTLGGFLAGKACLAVSVQKR